MYVAESQLKLIFETLGTPTQSYIQSIQDQYVQQKVLEASYHLGHFSKIPFEKIAKNVSAEAYDLLEKMLEIDYSKRITADDALKHPYFSDLHSEEDEVRMGSE